MTVPSVVCDSCGHEIKARDAFCPSCGAEVTAEQRQALQAAGPRSRLPRRESYAARSRARKVHTAGVWILVLAIIFAVFGTIYGFMNKSEVDDAQRVLSLRDDSDVLTIEGETKTVGEWEKSLDTMVKMIFLTNYVLAAIFIGLFVWSKKKPFPAIVTAFCVFIVVHLLNAVVDPSSIPKGIIVKVLAIIFLGGGIKASLDQRAVEQRLRSKGAGTSRRQRPGRRHA